MANSNTAAKGEKGDVGLCGRIAEGKASIGKSTAATTATLCVKGVNIFYPKGSKTSSIFFYYHLISHSLSQPRVQSGNRKKCWCGILAILFWFGIYVVKLAWHWLELEKRLRSVETHVISKRTVAASEPVLHYLCFYLCLSLSLCLC